MADSPTSLVLRALHAYEWDDPDWWGKIAACADQVKKKLGPRGGLVEVPVAVATLENDFERPRKYRIFWTNFTFFYNEGLVEPMEYGMSKIEEFTEKIQELRDAAKAWPDVNKFFNEYLENDEDELDRFYREVIGARETIAGLLSCATHVFERDYALANTAAMLKRWPHLFHEVPEEYRAVLNFMVSTS